MQKNTPQLWDELWKDTSIEEDKFNLAREEKSIRWQRIENLILKNFKSFNGLNVIEIGAGGGTNSLLFAKRGANVTILDYSKNALKRSKEFFDRNNCKANYVYADALNLPEKLLNKFDVSMSFGLSEHFLGDERIKINKAHLDLLNNNGIAIISVPNKLNVPYRMNKFALQKLGKWKYGEEYPYQRKEFIKIAKDLGLSNYGFFGDSFFKSLRYINPFLLVRKKNFDISKLKKERGFFLDNYVSYTLVFFVKPN